jgi:hypothetical protein
MRFGLFSTARVLTLLTIAICAVLGGSAQAAGFIENRGQIDAAVLYYISDAETGVYFTPEGLVLDIRDLSGQLPPRDYPTRRREQRPRSSSSRYALAIRFADASESAVVVGAGELPGRFHYLVGDDQERWRSNLRAFDRVVYRGVWPGVDLVYRIENGQLVYEVVAEPGADTSVVAFAYDGVRAVASETGARRLETPLGVIEDMRPTENDRVGRLRVLRGDDRQIVSRPAPAPAAATAELGMELRWGSFLGGARDDSVSAVAVADGEYPVVTGSTLSADFPTTLGVLDPTYNSSFDAFVTKFDYDGSTLLWSTFLGATSDDRGWAIRIDDAGRPVVAGITSSDDFPVTVGAYDTTFNGDYDGFVSKLEADGSGLVWSTYYGGNDREWDVSGLDLDAAGRPVFIGSTRSSDLPTSAGAFAGSLNGTRDAFVAALAADGATLVFGTYLGGADSDQAEDVAWDSAGRPVVVGSTTSTDYPVTPGSLQEVSGGGRDAVVSKLTSDAGSLVFSTYVGGDSTDDAYGVVLSESGEIVVSGGTESSDFPTTPGTVSPTFSGFEDAFVTRLLADGSGQVWGTFFGGTGGEEGLDIVLDAVDRPIFVGWTCSFDFPLAGPPFSDSFFPCDGYITRLRPDASVALYSSYIGGWRDDSTFAVALDDRDRVVMGGQTYSTNFPTTSNAFDRTHNSPDTAYDGFVVEMLTRRFCTFLGGDTVPVLTMGKAVQGNCPDQAPGVNLADLIEGNLEALNPADIGAVRRIACDSTEVVFGTDDTPAPGFGYFQLARFEPGGSYADGGNPGLVGLRVPLAGDCP